MAQVGEGGRGEQLLCAGGGGEEEGTPTVADGRGEELGVGTSSFSRR